MLEIFRTGPVLSLWGWVVVFYVAFYFATLFSVMLTKSIFRVPFLHQVHTVSFTSTAWFQSFKATVLSLISAPDQGAKVDRKPNLQSPPPATTSNPHGMSPTLVGLLDQFQAQNHPAPLQLLAELGAHFTEARSIAQFHQLAPSHSLQIESVTFSWRSTSFKELDIHGHLSQLQMKVLTQMPPAAALDVYRALAALRAVPSEELHEAIFASLIANIEELNLADMASYLQTRSLLMPNLECEMMKEMLTKILRRSKKRQTKDVQHVVTIFGVFAECRLHNPELLSEMIDFVKGRVQSLSPSELVHVIHYLTELHTKDEKLFDAIVVEILHRGADKLSPSEISTLAASLTKSAHFDVMTDVLLDSLALSCKDRIHNLTFEELVNLLWAYTHHMHFHHNDKLLLSLAYGLVDKIDGVGQISGSTAVKLCEIVAATDFQNEVSFCLLDNLSRQGAEICASLGKMELLCVLNSCKKAKFHCDHLLGTLKEQLLAQRDELTPAQLCSLINNSAALDFHPGHEILQKSMELTHSYEQLNPSQICNTIWSLMYFDLLTSENGAALFQHLQHFSRSKFNALDIQELLLSEKLLLLKEGRDETIIPEPLRSELVEMWRERIYFTRSISPFQQEISRSLNKLNISHEAEALIDNGDLSVDFLLFMRKSDSEERIILECDGPRRRSINAPFRPLGQTLTFKRLMKAQGWKVITVSKQEWQKKTFTEQDQYLRSLLNLQSPVVPL